MLKKVDQARLGEYFSKEPHLAAINNVVLFFSVSILVKKTESQKYRIMEYKTDFPEMVTI